MNIISNEWWKLGLMFWVFGLVATRNYAQTYSPNGTVTVATTGNNTAAGYTTIYLLTNATGVIQNQITLSGNTFSAPNTAGTYKVYTINYFTGNAPSFTTGVTNISAITETSCRDLDAGTTINVCYAASSSISFNTTGNNTTVGYTTKYVVTNAADVIQNEVTSPFTAPTSGGSYKLYTINYSGTAPTLTTGINIAAIGGTCIHTSNINFEVCASTCKTPGSSIAFSTTGNNTTAGYSTKYVVANALGVIQNEVTSPFTAPISAGNYKLYTINYTGTAPTLTAGTNINAIGGTCIAVNSGLDFEVCAPTCGTNAVVLASTSKFNLSPKCTDGGWTYYGSGASSEVYFAINWNPLGLTGAASNDAAKTAATANITVDTNPYSPTMNSTTGEDSWAMRRYWNVDLNGTTIDASNPVKVRFYYDNIEKTAITTAANTAVNTYTSFNLGIEPFTWFKTESGSFVPSANVTAETIINSIALTDDNVSTQLKEGLTNDVLYAQFSGITSFSGGTGGIGVKPVGGGSPLPVSLLSFSGKANGKINDLVWTTASEQNTAYHIVQRSATGNGDWKEIGRVRAAGNSNIRLDYTFSDTEPLPRSYYRIYTLDFDAKYQISNTIKIDKTKDDFGVMAVYPIPTTNIVNIAYESMSESPIRFSLIDAIGRIIEVQTVVPQKGLNTTTFDLSLYPDAIYILLMDNGNYRTISRLVKTSK